MGDKPALMSGKDCEQMGLVKIHADEVYTTQGLHLPLQKPDVTKQFQDIYEGISCLQPPVSFKTDDKVTPIQMPIHRVPISKRQKEN